MTPNSRKLQQKISRIYLGLVTGLMLVVLATVSIVLVMELRGSLKASLLNKAFHVTKRMELNLTHVTENVENFSENHFIINSIVHPLERGVYLPKMVDDFSRLQSITAVSILDYTGNILYSTHDEPSDYKKTLYLRPVLETADSIIKLSRDATKIFIIEPVLHYETPIGAVLAEVDLEVLTSRIIPEDTSEFYKLYARDRRLLSHNFQEDSDYILINEAWEQGEFPILYSLGMRFEMGKLMAVHLKPVFVVIIQLVIIGTLFLVLAVFISAKVGNSLARPILTMVEKTEHADTGATVSFSPVGTNDELEILALALDKRDTELKAYRDTLEEKVAERTLELSEVNARLEEEGRKRERTLLLLEHSEARTRAIVDNLLDGIITINDRGTIDTFNPAAEKIFGYAGEEVIGQNVKLLMPEPYYGEHDDYIGNYLETGTQKIIGIGREVAGKRKDGTTFPMDLSVNAMQVRDSRMFAGIIRDITDRKKAEQQLVDAKNKAEQANRLKSEFLNTMSHELRTPLTVMMGNIAFLTDPDDIPDEEDMLDIATDIEKAGEHLMQLINDLLDISKIEAGKMELNKERVAVRRLVDDCLATMGPLAKQKGLDLNDDVTDMEISADPLRIKQVLLNLLSNAVKFTDQGSVTVSVESIDGRASFQIVDTGCGIEKEKVGLVFEKFTQVDGSATRAAGGSGLGLTITKKLVELHGGDITADSELGKGTVFRFNLPADEHSDHTG